VPLAASGTSWLATSAGARMVAADLNDCSATVDAVHAEGGQAIG